LTRSTLTYVLLGWRDLRKFGIISGTFDAPFVGILRNEKTKPEVSSFAKRIPTFINAIIVVWDLPLIIS